MTEQEQIDRIAKDIMYSIEDCHGNHCATCYMRERCTVKYHARKVYSAGYRKANDVIDEFVKRLEKYIGSRNDLWDEDRPEFDEEFVKFGIQIVADEMRQEVEK